MKSFSAWQFTFFRIIFGLYLAIHFAQLAPWAGELFGSHGVIREASLNPTARLFPNPLAFPLPEPVLVAILWGLVLASLAFAAGIARHAFALVLWFGWCCLFHRNNLIANPSIPYVGLILILTMLVPGGEPISRGKHHANWEMPAWVFRTAWILMATSYTFSGLTKLHSASWLDGSAMARLLDNPLARPGAVRDLMTLLPAGVLALMTWGTLAVELLFAPLALWRRARPFLWLAVVLLHAGILLVIDFSDLSLGMLMIHFFTFDPRWLPAKTSAHGFVIARFDDDCLVCNRFVRFLAEEDLADVIRFAPLSAAAEERTTLEVEFDGVTLRRSTGVLRLFTALGGHWRFIAIVAATIPRRLRDFVYDTIASHRHRLFRASAVCELPSEKLRASLRSEAP